MAFNPTLDQEGLMNKKKMPPVEDAHSHSSATDSSGDENEERGNWAGRMDFMLSCIGYGVGLGNIWRFPYLCYRNGGAVFLIPYLLCLVLWAMPMVLMEMSIGQFVSLGPISIWRVSPLFKGLGYGMCIFSVLCCTYYNIIIGWTLYYVYLSCRARLPWASCGNWWNTAACAIVGTADAASVNGTSINGTSINGTLVNGTDENVLKALGRYMTAIAQNTTVGNLSVAVGNVTTAARKSPSEEFWQRYVLQISDGIDNMGGVRIELLICLFAAWVLVFLCLIKGVKSSGRVVYVTATLPYVVLIILLVRGVTLPGALNGIKFYLIPQWDKLKSLKVWGEGAMQIFYSQGASWGAIMTMASYNKWNNNCYRDARIVPLMNSGTSIFAGFVIFSIIGFMAHETGAEVKDVVTSGPGLVFVVYPEALSKLPISPLWAILFFLMLITIGLDSQFATFETVTSAVIDEFPHLLRKRKTLVNAGLCVVLFLLGIPCVTEGGIYFLQLMDWYSVTYPLMLISLLEGLAIAWIYGADRLYKDIELMTGCRPSIWWKICWKFITPSLTLFIFTYGSVMHTPVTYGGYHYPGWAVSMGWSMAVASMVPIPIFAAIAILKQKGTFIERLKKAVALTPEWGPALTHHRKLYIETLDETGRANTLLSIDGESFSDLDEKQRLQIELQDLPKV